MRNRGAERRKTLRRRGEKGKGRRKSGGARGL